MYEKYFHLRTSLNWWEHDELANCEISSANIWTWPLKKINACAAYRFLTVEETDVMSMVKVKAGVKLNMENINHQFLMI